MTNATQPPRRMRFSFESRCRLVRSFSLVKAAAAVCGASPATAYRLWRRSRREAGGASRPTASAEAPATPSLCGARAVDPRCSRNCCVAMASRVRGSPPVGRSCVMSGSVQANSCTSISSARSLLDGRQAHPRRRHQPLTARGLAAPAPRDRRSLPARLRRASPKRKPRRLRRLFSAPPSPSTPSVGSRSRASSQIAAMAAGRLARCLCRARDRSSLHTPPTTADQRQGRSTRKDAPSRVRLPLRLSDQRAPRPCARRLRWYNRHRPHSSLGGQPPISRDLGSLLGSCSASIRPRAPHMRFRPGTRSSACPARARRSSPTASATPGGSR